ncbi:UNVERIFIED_CONTAM: hypothetical protein FKN15_054095 [Acipenser sinensis]
MPGVEPQCTSDQGDNFNGTTPGSLRDSLRPNLSSPSRGPEGLRPQTHLFAQHQLQYWRNCTSDYCFSSHPTVVTPNVPTPSMAQCLSATPQARETLSAVRVSPMLGSPTLVEETLSPERRHKNGSDTQPSSGDHRRVQLRLGSGLGRQRSLRTLGRPLGILAHKCCPHQSIEGPIGSFDIKCSVNT